MKTPLATLTGQDDASAERFVLQRSSDRSGGLFVGIFKSQMEIGINGALQGRTPVQGPLGATSLSVTDMQGLGRLDAQAFTPTPSYLLPRSVIHASETPELPAVKDSEAKPVAGMGPASQEIDSGTPDVSEVQEETLSQIDDAQVVGTGTTGNLQAEDETMNTPAVQITQATSAQNTVRQNQNDAFSPESSFDRVLDQQVANRQQDQKNLDKQSSARKEERADKPSEDSDINAVEKEARARAEELARSAQQITIDPDTSEHSKAINNALAIAEAMRPTKLPVEDLPAKTAFTPLNDRAKSALHTTADGKSASAADALAVANAKLAGEAGTDIAARDNATADTGKASRTALNAETSAAGQINLAALGASAETAAGVTAAATPPARPLPAKNTARDTATTKAAPVTALKDPSPTSTAALFAAQQGKTDTQAGTQQDAMRLAQTEIRPSSELSGKDSFSTTFNAIAGPGGTTTPGGMAQMLNNLHAPGTAANSARLQTQVGHPGWNQALGQHMVMMAGSAQQTATLTLNPPELGPLQVVLQLQNSQADATFITAQPEVKQALEAALPRLREMMEQAGIELGQASVNTGTPQQQSAQQQYSRSQNTHVNAFGADNEDTAPLLATLPTVGNSRGIVDTFA